jgi:hypothetical protein
LHARTSNEDQDGRTNLRMVGLCVCVSVYLFVCASVYLCVCVSVCLCTVDSTRMSAQTQIAFLTLPVERNYQAQSLETISTPICISFPLKIINH